MIQVLLLVVSAMAAGLTTAGPLSALTVPLAFGCLVWVMGPGLARRSAMLFLWLLVYFFFSLGWMIWALQSPGEWTFAWSVPLVLVIFSMQSAIYAGCYSGLLLLASLLIPGVHRKALHKAPMTHACALGLAFLLGDLLRSLLSIGTPWGALGYSQTINPLMSGMFAWVGSMGVSALLVFLTSISVDGIRSSRVRRQGQTSNERRTWHPQSFVPLSVVATTVALCLLANTSQWTTASERTSAIRVVHTALYEGEKYTPQAQAAAQDLLLDLAQRTDVVATLYPELYLVQPAFQYPQKWRTDVMAAVKRSGNHQIVGAPDSLLSSERIIQGTTNALIQLSPEGSSQRRAKEALIPFTEQTSDNAFVSWVYGLFSAYPNSNFIPAGIGETRPFDLPGLKLAAAICSEISDPLIVNARQLEAGALLNAASESWILSATLDGMILQMLQARALESQKPILRAGNGGFSGLISERGEVTKTLALHAVVLLKPRTGETPFARAMARLYRVLNTPPSAQ